MLPKQHRLSLRRELHRVKKKGWMVPGKFFGLLLAPRSQPGTPRFGFIISTKVEKKAVVRNRVRRLLSEAVRSALPQVKSGFDGVFLVKKNAVGQELKAIKDEMKRVFKRAGILK